MIRDACEFGQLFGGWQRFDGLEFQWLKMENSEIETGI